MLEKKWKGKEQIIIAMRNLDILILRRKITVPQNNYSIKSNERLVAEQLSEWVRGETKPRRNTVN